MNDQDLRDCFAMFALNGYVSFMGCNPKGSGGICNDGEINSEAIARCSYAFADAMLEARNKVEDDGGITTIKKRKYVRKD
jgi:hypothetical protein